MSSLARIKDQIRSRRVEVDLLVVVAEERDDASADDVEPGLVLPQHPAQPSSSGSSPVLAAVALHLVHPTQNNG